MVSGLEECALITRKYAVFLTFVCALALFAASCGKDSPSAPSQPSVVTLTSPSIESPGTDEQLVELAQRYLPPDKVAGFLAFGYLLETTVGE